MQISSLSINDKDQWQQLYRAYADFYNVPMKDDILATVWSWIFDDQQSFYALIAKNEGGEAIGFMHFREMTSPLRGKMVGFLDDLYVTPSARGTGCVQALYDELNQFGKTKGWPLIRWITAENNYQARASYDKIADKTQWVTYEMNIDLCTAVR